MRAVALHTTMNSNDLFDTLSIFLTKCSGGMVSGNISQRAITAYSTVYNSKRNRAHSQETDSSEQRLASVPVHSEDGLQQHIGAVGAVGPAG